MRIDTKEKIQAPCHFVNAFGKKAYPAVDCSYFCEGCPWNPVEAKRRIAEGKFVETSTVHGTIRKLVYPAPEFAGRKGETENDEL